MITNSVNHEGYLAVELELKEASLATADQFKAEMVLLIDTADKYFIIDFKKVDFVDSSFLGALVSALKYAMTKNADIAVANLNKDIDNLFRLIRMDKVFKIYETLPASL